MNVQLLGELLLAKGLVKQVEIDNALMVQAKQGGRLGEVLVRLGAVSTNSLYQVLSEQLDYPLASADALDEAAMRETMTRLRVGAQWWLDRQVLLWQDQGQVLHVASADPLDIDVREALADEPLAAIIEWRLLLPAMRRSGRNACGCMPMGMVRPWMHAPCASLPRTRRSWPSSTTRWRRRLRRGPRTST